MPCSRHSGPSYTVERSQHGSSTWWRSCLLSGRTSSRYSSYCLYERVTPCIKCMRKRVKISPASPHCMYHSPSSPPFSFLPSLLLPPLASDSVRRLFSILPPPPVTYLKLQLHASFFSGTPLSDPGAGPGAGGGPDHTPSLPQ